MAIFDYERQGLLFKHSAYEAWILKFYDSGIKLFDIRIFQNIKI